MRKFWNKPTLTFVLGLVLLDFATSAKRELFVFNSIQYWILNGFSVIIIAFFYTAYMEGKEKNYE